MAAPLTEPEALPLMDCELVSEEIPVLVLAGVELLPKPVESELLAGGRLVDAWS